MLKAWSKEIADLKKRELKLLYVARIDRDSKITHVRGKVVDVFLTSARLIKYLQSLGLTSTNKVKNPISVPLWVMKKSDYRRAFLRGFFDTDGSVYKLRFGIQLSFTSKTANILQDIHKILILEGFRPSQISCFKVYLTAKNELERLFRVIKVKNVKHLKRYKFFLKSAGVREVDKPSSL